MNMVGNGVSPSLLGNGVMGRLVGVGGPLVESAVPVGGNESPATGDIVISVGGNVSPVLAVALGDLDGASMGSRDTDGRADEDGKKVATPVVGAFVLSSAPESTGDSVGMPDLELGALVIATIIGDLDGTFVGSAGDTDGLTNGEGEGLVVGFFVVRIASPMPSAVEGTALVIPLETFVERLALSMLFSTSVCFGLPSALERNILADLLFLALTLLETVVLPNFAALLTLLTPLAMTGCILLDLVPPLLMLLALIGLMGLVLLDFAARLAVVSLEDFELTLKALGRVPCDALAQATIAAAMSAVDPILMLILLVA